MSFFLKKNDNGFTLIELLTVIIIMGIFLLVIIPSVSTYVLDAKKSTYINTARGYIKEVKNMISSRELTSMKKADTTFYIPIQCIHKESGGDSPFGEWESAYVVVIYDGEGFKFYWTSNDDNDMGILLTPEELLANERIVPELTGITTSAGIGGRSKILVMDKNVCTIENAKEKSPVINLEPDEMLDEDDLKDVDIEDELLRPEYIISPKGWAQKKTVTINYPGSSTKKEYSLDGGMTWQNYTKPLTFTENGSVIAKNTIGNVYINGNSQTVMQLDSTPPTEATFTYSVTSKSIKVVANGYDPESGVKYFRFSNDNGATWSAVQEGNTYSFTNLRTGTYKIKIQAINATYENNKLSGSTLDSAMQEVATAKINQPIYSVNPDTSNWVQKKTVTITYDSGYKKEYSIDGGRTWIEYTGPIEFTKTGTIIARSHDELNYVTSSSFSVTRVDSTPPTSATFTTTATSNSVIVTAVGVDNESGIARYQFSKNGGSTWENVTSNSTYTFSNLTSGTYNIKVRVINNTYTEHGLSNNYKESGTTSVTTNSITTPTYTISPDGYAREKTVTINYPSGYTNEYSLNGGTTWDTYSNPILFTAEGTVVARVNDGVNFVTASTQTISGIDRENPTCVLEGIGETTSTGVYTNGATVQFKSKDGTGSPIVQYGIGSLTGSPTGTLSTSDASKTFTGYVKDSAGNVGSCSITLQGDSSPPVCSVSVTSNNSPSGITFNWSCTDSGSGVSGTSSATVSNVTSNWSRTVSDVAGNSTTITVNVARRTQYRYRDCTGYNCTTEIQDHCGFTSGCGGGCIVCAYSTKCVNSNQGTHYCRSEVTSCDYNSCRSWGSWSSWGNTAYSNSSSRNVETRVVYYRA